MTDAATGAVVRAGRASHPDGTEVDPAAWWSALQAAIADAGGLDDVAAWAIGGQQHGMVVLDADGRVIRPALLWNDTRSAGAAADLIAEFGAEDARAAHRPRARRILHDHEAALAARPRARQRRARRRRRAAARLADLAPARLRSRRASRRAVRCSTSSSPTIGCLGHRLLGPRDRRLRPRAARRRARPRRGAAARARPRRVGRRTKPVAGSARAPATTPAPRSDSTRSPGDVVVSIGTSGTVFAVSEQRTIDPTGTVAGFADCDGRFLPLVATLNAARVLDAIARLLGRRPRRAQPPRARRRARRRRPHARPVLRGRAHAEPARCHGIAHRHDPRLDDAREPRARRRRGHARRDSAPASRPCARSACRSSARC